MQQCDLLQESDHCYRRPKAVEKAGWWLTIEFLAEGTFPLEALPFITCFSCPLRYLFGPVDRCQSYVSANFEHKVDGQSIGNFRPFEQLYCQAVLAGVPTEAPMGFVSWVEHIAAQLLTICQRWLECLATERAYRIWVISSGELGSFGGYTSFCKCSRCPGLSYTHQPAQLISDDHMGMHTRTQPMGLKSVVLFRALTTQLIAPNSTSPSILSAAAL